MKNKVAIVTTVKAPKREIIEFVNYHLNIGIDHIFLFFDDPIIDKEILLTFLLDKRITIIPCTQEHWNKVKSSATNKIETRQKANANYAITLALKKNISWLSHIDIDELIYTKDSLKTLLHSIPNKAAYLWLKTYEAIPGRNKANSSMFQSTSIFKVNSHHNLRILIQDTKNINSTNILYHGEFFRGHTGGKSIVRISESSLENISCLGIHKPTYIETKNISHIETDNTFLLHYDCCNFADWLIKWERRYDGSATFNGRKNRKKQFDEFIRIYKKDSIKELKQLYFKNHCLEPDKILLLEKYKLIKHILISKKYFEYRNKKNKKYFYPL